MTDLSTLLLRGSARAIGAAIAAGATTSAQVTAWYLQRIESMNGGDAGLNCVRTVSPRALEQAARADAELAAGQVRGPLHGVPYLLKDNVFTTDGSPASAGARALACLLPPYQATLVTRLHAAGAVLLGKTNMTEFADFVADTMPSEFSGAGGVVRHPAGLRYGRGLGSSVGSAAAMAARLCAFAIGTETQNSIQAPALHSGVVGFKPTVGRISRHGVVPLVPSQDSPGPLTATVDDAALVYAALAGPDSHDPATLAAFAGTGDVHRPLAGLRIGIPRRFLADAVATPGRRGPFERLLARLADAGAVIVDPCDLLSAAALAEVRSSVFRSEFRDSLNGLLAQLRPCGMASLDAIVAWNRAHPDAIPYGQSLLEAALTAPGIDSDQYREDRQRDIALSLDLGIHAALRQGQADVLLVPMAAAAKCTGKAGAPVVALPAGLDDDGMPFGVTVFAAPGSDRLVLAAAAALERAIG
ncbi:amidase family protein [Pseudoduganella armeniaca]|uniref:Amidase n=1 Tax=Pseudoduganella armeniaca TaxID=2072590 RepID=A0A2R4C9A8_9BURK|nr:amidase family protein [Pseudoduganella armeniaca]AVR96206.1 amidase [Pseudoduganella armeniaca]